MPEVCQHTILIHPNDDVLIAKRDLSAGDVARASGDEIVLLHDVPAGHKIAACRIASGERIIKYDTVIGIAARDIEAGDHVHAHNLTLVDFERDPAFGQDVRPVEYVTDAERATFMGFVRPDGRVGTRNFIGILSSVNCSATVIKNIAAHFTPERLADFPHVDGVAAFAQTSGCGMSSPSEHFDVLRRTLAGYARHPNLAGVLIVGLGCERNQVASLVESQGLPESKLMRTLVMGLTGSHFVRVPDGVAPEMRRYYQQLTRFSAALAFLADVSMGTLGGALKRKEKLSARLGDVLSSLYLCSATLARFEREGRQAADAPLAHWAIWDAMFKAQNAFEGVITNFPRPLISALMRSIVFPLGRPYVVPSDQLGHDVARLLIEPSATRDRLTLPMYLGRDDEDPIVQIERALAATIAAEAVEAKLKAAARAGAFDAALAPGEGIDELAARAVSAGVVDAREGRTLVEQRALVAKVVRVDDFAPDLGTSLLAVAGSGETEPTAAPAAQARRHTAAA